MRTRIAARKGKKKQVAEGAIKSLSSKGKGSKDLKKATTDDEGRKLTKLIDRVLHDVATDWQGRQRKWTMQKIQTVQH